MISKRIRILAFTSFSCFALLSFVIGLQQTSISISNSGTISLKRGYICGNYNSTHYYAQNNVTGKYEWISTDAAQTISYALSKLTLGRTWQETVLLEGNFLIGTTITLSQANVILDCSQATLTLTANTILFSVTSGSVYTFLGGHFIGPNVASTSNVAFRFVSCANCLIDGADIEGFPGNNYGIFVIGYGSSGITVQNCYFHDNTNSGHIDVINGGYNKIINCTFANPSQAIFVADTSPHNQILGCEFYGWNHGGFGHGIYLDGGAGSIGSNIVSGCKFHDPVGSSGAALQIKCNNNSIHNNEFYNYPNNVVFSIYSQYTPSYANDNDIYNNTFTDCRWAIWLGHDPADYPTLRNKIHGNIFTNVTDCIMLNPFSGAINTVEDTWIYYNSFTLCTSIFPASGSSASLVKNTVIAYNDFGGTVTNLWVESCVNTMVYGNMGMADFNVPSPLPIPPKSGS